MRLNTTEHKAGFMAGLGVAAAGLVATVVVTACGSSTSKTNQPFLDAGQTGKVDLTNAVTIAMPDGFNNLAAKCVGHEGVYVTYHGDGAYGSIFIVPGDPNCATGTYADTNAR